MKYEFHPEALFELEAAADFYAERQKTFSISEKTACPCLSCRDFTGLSFKFTTGTISSTSLNRKIEIQ
jgi:hypothetical protein